jgi:putative SOS response-associated peptidase YedK
MCGRYFLEPEMSDEEWAKIVEALNRRPIPAGTKIAGEVFPTDVVPALAGGKVVAMRWGFTKPVGTGVVINARSETAGEKPMFRRAARCLIPAGGYYEWGREDRVKYALTGPNRTIYMAGLYRAEDAGPARFVILTRAAAPSVSHIHDRMPVILEGPARRAWLNPSVPAGEVLSEAVGEVQSAPQ